MLATIVHSFKQYDAVLNCSAATSNYAKFHEVYSTCDGDRRRTHE
jgi:hypothetical protein